MARLRAIRLVPASGDSRNWPESSAKKTKPARSVGGCPISSEKLKQRRPDKRSTGESAGIDPQRGQRVPVVEALCACPSRGMDVKNKRRVIRRKNSDNVSFGPVSLYEARNFSSFQRLGP
ncbi:hypothetical protein Aduo_008806 [Ancylostoma duodenale]